MDKKFSNMTKKSSRSPKPHETDRPGASPSAPPEIRIIRRAIGKMSDFQRAYGLWILSVNCTDGDPDPEWKRRTAFDNCRWRKFEFYSLSHLVSGAGRLVLRENGVESDVSPGQAILVTPGTVNRYGGWNGKPYLEDAICFCGPVADMLERSGVIGSGIFDFGHVRKIRMISEMIQDPSFDSQLAAHFALQKILVELCLGNRRHAADSPLGALLDMIKSDPARWWQVSELAEYCSLAPVKLRKLFLESTGVLPKRYIEELKLRQAAEMLATTATPVREVAARFGYHDPYHFSRRFKHFTGASPELYRREAAKLRSV